MRIPTIVVEESLEQSRFLHWNPSQYSRVRVRVRVRVCVRVRVRVSAPSQDASYGAWSMIVSQSLVQHTPSHWFEGLNPKTTFRHT
jgi:hypothetical protein